MQSKNRKVLSILLGLAMALGLVLGVSRKAFADDPVYYKAADGTIQEVPAYTLVDSSTNLLDTGFWYVVTEDTEIQIGLTALAGDLILMDGVTLTVSGGNEVGLLIDGGSYLNVYAGTSGEIAGSGKLVVSQNTGICIQPGNSALTVYGGTVQALPHRQAGEGFLLASDCLQ